MALLPQEQSQTLRNRVIELKPKLDALVRKFGIPQEDGEQIVDRTLRLYVQKEPSLRDDEAWATCIARASCIAFLQKNAAVSSDSVDERRRQKRGGLRLAGWVSTIGLFDSAG